MEDCLLTFSHLTSAAAGVVVFVFCITNLKKKILQSVAVCAGEGYVEAMISLVVFFPLPDFTMLTRPPVVCQTIFNKYIFTSFRSLHFFFFFPAHYTYSTKQNNNTSPPKFVFFFFVLWAYFLQRCLTTSTLNSSVMEQVSGKNNSLPSRANMWCFYRQFTVHLGLDTSPESD